MPHFYLDAASFEAALRLLVMFFGFLSDFVGYLGFLGNFFEFLSIFGGIFLDF